MVVLAGVECATGIYCLEGRDAAKQPAMQGSAPLPTKKNYPPPNVYNLCRYLREELISETVIVLIFDYTS